MRPLATAEGGVNLASCLRRDGSATYLLDFPFGGQKPALVAASVSSFSTSDVSDRLSAFAVFSAASFSSGAT